MRIMTTSYMKSLEMEKKYRNRKDVQGDEEYAKFKEEELNTQKMGSILKGLNSPKGKKGKRPGMERIQGFGESFPNGVE